MRVNGILKHRILTGGGLDTNGNPVAATATWSQGIDCLIIPNSNGRVQKYQDGSFTIANYTVHVEQPATMEVTTIQLTDSANRDLGEFQLIEENILYLETTGRLKLIV